MNLKEAFQAQNKIQELLIFISRYLSRSEHLVTVTHKHLKSKAIKGQEDEVLTLPKNESEDYDIGKLINIWQDLVKEKDNLQLAIAKAKANMNFNIDGAVDANKSRRMFIETLQVMANKKTSSVTLRGEGSGYILNNDGNPTHYSYDLERIESIDYDRKFVRSVLKNLIKEADKVSIQIDKALIETEVLYDLKFDLSGETRFIIEELLG